MGDNSGADQPEGAVERIQDGVFEPVVDVDNQRRHMLRLID